MGNKYNSSDIKASFLDSHLSDADGTVSSKICDKRDDFHMDIKNILFLASDISISVV